ncbi:hypothetical protein NUW58_g753 [Xylaria curta]|uniref:Uncharacterized protein n=1 Tax=Xylaria curta TaxID=42375 RepID=A0ACC1PN13_9PEZI|nr:hypothetical protein NUW58_g753 [Xylaria curta]
MSSTYADGLQMERSYTASMNRPLLRKPHTEPTVRRILPHLQHRHWRRTGLKPLSHNASLRLLATSSHTLSFSTQLDASELHRDEVVPDEDALRWAEAYRQKRAKKKKRDEEDDDRVLVGTKVDENHANWTTAYNMLTGIRVSVSRTNAKLDRPLTDEDFEAKQKSTFDIAGNELVPSAKYDFKFKDYAPWVFRHLRALFRLDPADYLMSLTGKYILSELGSPGKSGSFFYFSRDYKYIIKTIHHGEHKFLRKILKDYYNHVIDNPNTLLSQFYGLHRVKMPYGKKIHFVVMNNLFPPHRDIHTTFDLKGSTIGRDYKEEDLENNPRATLKDLNWLRRKRHLELGLQKRQLFLQQLQNDVKLLQKLKIMDYSLLIGMHDLRKGNGENLRDKTLQVFNPGGAGQAEDGPDPNQGVAANGESRATRTMRQTSDRMPDELAEGHSRGGLFYNDDGGLRATHEDNTAGEEVYYLGVIDCLTHYGMIKKIEHFWKGLSSDRTQISALPPDEYGDRFLKFMSGITMSPEEAARDQSDRVAAAAAMVPSVEGQSVPPVPSYLPPAPPEMRSPRSPEPNPTVEAAFRKAMKTEKDIAKEDQIPERKITTAAAPLAGRTNSHTVLPVVEESAEAASLGGRSRGESTNTEPRPFTPSPRERQDGFTDLGPHESTLNMQSPYAAFLWALAVQVLTSVVGFGISASISISVSTNANISRNASAHNNIINSHPNSTSNVGSVKDSNITQWDGTHDPCTGATYELGKEYSTIECMAIHKYLPDGTCDWTKKQPDQTTCAEFCQTRTTFFPMQEIPITNTYCRGPRRCRIPRGNMLRAKVWWSGTDTELSALENGVSGGFDPREQAILAGAGDVTIGEGQCGYFTWIGTRKSVCGSLTQATRHEPVNGGHPYCQHPATTTGNFCADAIYSGPTGKASDQGTTVFVNVDCDTRAALPPYKQDALFKFDGVALPAEKLDEIMQTWVATECTLDDHFLWYSFEMQGRGLKDSLLGEYGNYLLNRLRDCHAAVTGWTFVYTPDNITYDWKASGNIDPFDYLCPGVALKGIGANNVGNC